MNIFKFSIDLAGQIQLLMDPGQRNKGNSGQKMETQGTDRAESGSRWAEFHENLAYCMFNLVRKQNFGSQSHSGSELFVFFLNFGSYKKIMKISKFYFGPGSPKNRFVRKFLREKSGIRESRVRRRFRESRVRRRFRESRVRRRKPG